MNNRIVAGLIAIGFLVGGIAVYPIAHATQAVKTVTKTRTVSTQTTIQNGEPINQVLKSLGRAAAITKRPTAADNYVACEAWGNSSGSNLKAGDWALQLCVKTQ